MQLPQHVFPGTLWPAGGQLRKGRQVPLPGSTWPGPEDATHGRQGHSIPGLVSFVLSDPGEITCGRRGSDSQACLTRVCQALQIPELLEGSQVPWTDSPGPV